MATALRLPILKIKFPTLRESVVLALFAALMVALQVALAALPNIEFVSLLIILLTHRMGLKSLWSIYVFAIVEALLYPSGTWIISYFYVWTILAVAVAIIRKNGNVLLYAIIAAFFGILFGTLCSVPSFIIGGFGYGVSWIISGLSFDLMHCVSNLVTVGLLFLPLDRALARILK